MSVALCPVGCIWRQITNIYPGSWRTKNVLPGKLFQNRDMSIFEDNGSYALPRVAFLWLPIHVGDWRYMCGDCRVHCT